VKEVGFKPGVKQMELQMYREVNQKRKKSPFWGQKVKVMSHKNVAFALL